MTTLVIAIDGMDPDYLRRGLGADLVDRIYKTAVKFRADAIVRIAGDCPPYGFSEIKVFVPEGHPKPLVIGTRPLDILPAHEVD